jgi:hypothetical protein
VEIVIITEASLGVGIGVGVASNRTIEKGGKFNF